MIQFTVNPFRERASGRLLSRGYFGGQHAASVGDSTRYPLPWDPLAHSKFDVDGASNAEPQPSPSESVLAQFERARRAAIAAGPEGIPF